MKIDFVAVNVRFNRLLMAMHRITNGQMNWDYFVSVKSHEYSNNKNE